MAEKEWMKEKSLKTRYYLLDGIRGISLISMILYHTIWDLVYIYGKEMNWFRSAAGYVWQQSICWTFILLSGFCWSMGRHKLRRSMYVLAAGFLITLITVVFMPEQRIVFGVLTLMGSCMLFLIPLEEFLEKCPPWMGLAGSVFLFCLSRNISRGYLGFEMWNIMELPEFLYGNLLSTYLGFPYGGFFSTDYFPVFPWIFLFLAGHFLYAIFREKEMLNLLCGFRLPGLEFLGKNSLQVYLIHQPVIYIILLGMDFF